MTLAQSDVQEVGARAQKYGFKTLVPASNTVIVKNFLPADPVLQAPVMELVDELEAEHKYSCEDLVVEF